MTHSVAAASKKSKWKRKDDKDETSQAPKKAKVERISAGESVAKAAKPVEKQSPSPRIFEVEDSGDAMSIN